MVLRASEVLHWTEQKNGTYAAALPASLFDTLDGRSLVILCCYKISHHSYFNIYIIQNSSIRIQLHLGTAQHEPPTLSLAVAYSAVQIMLTSAISVTALHCIKGTSNSSLYNPFLNALQPGVGCNAATTGQVHINGQPLVSTANIKTIVACA